MARFTLFAKGNPAPADVEAIETDSAVRILDRTGNRAFLVDIDRDYAAALAQRLAGWIVEPERVHPRP